MAAVYSAQRASGNGVFAAQVYESGSGPTYTLTANPAAIAFTSQSADILAHRALQASPSAIALTGQVVDLTYSAAAAATYTLTANAASLVLGGQSAILLAARHIAVGPAVFALTGQAVGLNYAGYVEPPSYIAGAITRPRRIQTGTRASR